MGGPVLFSVDTGNNINAANIPMHRLDKSPLPFYTI